MHSISLSPIQDTGLSLLCAGSLCTGTHSVQRTPLYRAHLVAKTEDLFKVVHLGTSLNSLPPLVVVGPTVVGKQFVCILLGCFLVSPNNLIH